MRLNERGATLAIVLLVILVFSVLGLAIMGNVVGENKRVNTTETNVQDRYLEENGLTFFENEFKTYVNKTDLSAVNIDTFLNSYSSFKPIDPSKPYETNIKASRDPNDNNQIIVYSIAKPGSSKILNGYYKISFDDNIKTPSFDMMKFDKDGTIAIDFSQMGVAGLNLLNLLSLGVLDFTGSSNDSYIVPTDSAISKHQSHDVLLRLNVLGPVLDLNLSKGNFETMRLNRVIASNDGEVLKLNLANIAMIDLLPYQGAGDLNVMINGNIPGVTLLGIQILTSFKDIEFKKLAVMGNAVIQQGNNDSSSSRRFTFAEGLYVNKSLVIGGSNDTSNLTLRGNMVASQDLKINNAVVTLGDTDSNEASFKPEDYISNLYVWGNATVSNSTINVKNSKYTFGLLASGKITIDNNKKNNIYNGLFYSQTGIDIKTNGKPMTIKGGVIGNYTVDYPDKLTIITDPQYLNKVNLSNIKLIPKGRKYN